MCFCGEQTGGSRLGLRRRSKIEIIEDILSLCSTGSSKSNILYHCNLNSVRLTPLLEVLLHMDLLEEVENSGRTAVFKTTLHGLHFLKSYLSGNSVERLGPIHH